MKVRKSDITVRLHYLLQGALEIQAFMKTIFEQSFFLLQLYEIFRNDISTSKLVSHLNLGILFFPPYTALVITVLSLFYSASYNFYVFNVRKISLN